MKHRFNNINSDDVEVDSDDVEVDSDEEEKFIRKPTLTELDRYSDEETDSETEALQEAFAKGILKPGLNVIKQDKKKIANNVTKLKQKLNEIKLDMAWIERLDIITKPASIAPELAKQLEEDQEPIVRDDFKRESLFYRQAQAAVLEAIPKIHSLGILTKRPDDYFAEMAKSDSQMQKVKSRLIQKKTVMERIEKVRQIRKQKKLQKSLQAESKLKKQNARKELANEVKKFRKGERKDLSFLEDKPSAPLKRKVNKKRQKRDTRFGFGGRKRGSKRNTKDSIDSKSSKKSGAKKALKVNRPGKDRRKNMRTKKR